MLSSVTLGVTGSIAAYRAADLARELGRQGCRVSVVMTSSATRFVAPLTFETLTGQPVATSLWDSPLAHIELARASAMVVAPATANILSKAALGIADDLLSSILLAAGRGVVFAPAMNWRMYRNPLIQSHIREICDRGHVVVAPEAGLLACGEEGEGRLADLREVALYVRRALRGQDLAGRKVLVTSGPTREPLDPVRFLSNRSSGKMGMSMALEAFLRGADVTLISGPAVYEYVPKAFEYIGVETASEMLDQVMKKGSDCDIVVMVAAVADFTPDRTREDKLERGRAPLSVTLKATEDILGRLGRRRKRPFLVGFSAEVGNFPDRAATKMKKKGADLMVFNDVTAEGAGFEADTNQVTLIHREGSRKALPVISKAEVAKEIFDSVVKELP